MLDMTGKRWREEKSFAREEVGDCTGGSREVHGGK